MHTPDSNRNAPLVETDGTTPLVSPPGTRTSLWMPAWSTDDACGQAFMVRMPACNQLIFWMGIFGPDAEIIQQ